MQGNFWVRIAELIQREPAAFVINQGAISLGGKGYRADRTRLPRQLQQNLLRTGIVQPDVSFRISCKKASVTLRGAKGGDGGSMRGEVRGELQLMDCGPAGVPHQRPG